MSRLACEQKKIQVIRKRKQMAEKKTIEIKSMFRIIVWYFSNGWLFLPFTLLQVNYADMVHAWYRENGFYHWTYHSCSSNTIHCYHGGGVGTIIHILAHITGKLVCIFPVTPDTVFFIKQWEQLRLKWKGADTQQRRFTVYRNHMCLFDRQ